MSDQKPENDLPEDRIEFTFVIIPVLARHGKVSDKDYDSLLKLAMHEGATLATIGAQIVSQIEGPIPIVNATDATIKDSLTGLAEKIGDRSIVAGGLH